ncbi:MAG: hypothetical protein MK102_04915 [Fuerstiella sp.]|nr:hypothetical protein [Fuerstiella sp.]
MTRTHLRLFAPQEESVLTEQDVTDTDRPNILPFRRRSKAILISGRFTAPSDRARMIRNNCVCPECELTDVEPVELEDAVLSRHNHRPIPGTATIVGFHCNHCGKEWPVYELTTRHNG